VSVVTDAAGDRPIAQAEVPQEAKPTPPVLRMALDHREEANVLFGEVLGPRSGRRERYTISAVTIPGGTRNHIGRDSLFRQRRTPE